MAILIAHQEDCDLITKGPTVRYQVGENAYRVEAQPCSCGGFGISIRLVLHSSNNTLLISYDNAFPLPRKE